MRQSDVDQPVRYSLVVPVYGNEGTIEALVERVAELNRQLGGALEGVFVVDASPDRSGELLKKALPMAQFRWQLLWHSRNFGSFAAIRTGMVAARGGYLAAMAADLQEPAELILEFFETLDAGEVDIAIGVRSGRDDPRLSKMMAQSYWRLYRRTIEPQIPEGGVDVFACTARVARVLGEFTESHSSLVGLLFWVGFNRVEIAYQRAERPDGARSGWSFRRKVGYMMDSIYSFTDLPLALMKVIGTTGVAVSLGVGLVTLVSWLTGLIEVRGYTPLVLLLLFLSSVMILCLGIVGSYVWRTYENSKARPGSLVMWHEQA